MTTPRETWDHDRFALHAAFADLLGTLARADRDDPAIQALCSALARVAEDAADVLGPAERYLFPAD